MNKQVIQKSTQIKLLDGLKIGHHDDGKTGVTVFLLPSNTIGGVSIRGAAPGTRETDLLKPEKAISELNAVVLSGGSAFGLSTCDGVMQYLSDKNIGFSVGSNKVPLVSGAVIYDLKDDKKNSKINYPNAKMGYEACVKATDKNLRWGRIGAGTGASCGKILSREFASSGGIGAATITLGEIFVTAVTVVNALGDVVDYKTNKIVAGVKDKTGKFLNTQDLILSGKLAQMLGLKLGGNTTLTLLMTNAKLTKLECNKLADISHNGYAKSISPVHTDYDGDTIFCVSKGEAKFDFTAISVMAVEAVCNSIVAAVRQAK